MKICFVLPRSTKMAFGGYKMVYEYANRLTGMGYNVSILFLNKKRLASYSVPRIVKKTYFDLINHREPRWFHLDQGVEKVSDYSERRTKDLLEQSDVAIATAVGTARYVSEHFETDNKIYFIQGRETWSGDDDYVDNTYRLGMKNIVVSRWLKDIVDEKTEDESILISNPVDTTEYRIIDPIESRKKHSLSVLYNPNPCKGFDNAFNVIMKLKEIYPDMTVKSFGAYPRPKYFPGWIDYTENANEKHMVEIYNQTQVYLCSALEDGYGLTGIEAMACGCALCSTDYAAVHEYAKDGENCLLSPVGDIDAQVANAVKLFEDDKLRHGLAKVAANWAKNHTWGGATQKLIEVIER